jgi:hypothetical protein
MNFWSWLLGCLVAWLPIDDGDDEGNGIVFLHYFFIFFLCKSNKNEINR